MHPNTSSCQSKIPGEWPCLEKSPALVGEQKPGLSALRTSFSCLASTLVALQYSIRLLTAHLVKPSLRADIWVQSFSDRSGCCCPSCALEEFLTVLIGPCPQTPLQNCARGHSASSSWLAPMRKPTWCLCRGSTLYVFLWRCLACVHIL